MSMSTVVWTVFSALSRPAAAGAVVVGPAGEAAPTSDATQVAIAPSAEANTVTIAVRIATAGSDLAVLWPMPGIVPTSAVDVDPDWLARIEAVTRPRVEALTCDDLVQTTHWRTVPGCSSTDYVPPPPDRGEDAADSVAIGGESAEVGLLVDVIEPEELGDWLALRGFALDPEVEAGLAPHLAAGEPILTVQPDRPVPPGSWLPPIRFVAGPGPLALPLAAAEPLSDRRQVLFVHGAGGPDTPNASIPNFPRGYVPDECMLPAGRSAADWVADARAAFEETATLPIWVLEHAGRVNACSPCTAEPLTAFELSTVGIDAVPAEARLSRLWLEWPAGLLDEDPVVAFEGSAPTDAELRFVAHDPDLGFAFPICGEDAPRPDAGRCRSVRAPDAGGCGVAGATPARQGALVALAGLLALSARRRPRALALGLLLLGVAPRARAAPDFDPGPELELGVGLSLVGTDRIVPTGLDHGAPWLLNPLLSVEARKSLFAWRRGRTVGALGQLHGLAGRAAPWGARGIVGFALLEPAVGLDVRHGRFREASPCLFGRYGAEVVLTTLWPDVSSPRAVASGGLHAGFGWWVGRGTRRTAIELRGSLVPRTDGYETRFHPNVDLPGWMFFPGSANVWVIASRARI